MKKILIILFICISFVTNAFGQAVANNLVGLGMSSELATYISTIIPGGAVLTNNSYLKSRNAANSADISILKVDATDDTVLNADTGDTIKLSVAGTAEATLNDDSLTFSGASFEFIPGATSLLFRNNADNATNLSITDAGAVTSRAGITATTGDVTSTAGDIVASTSGGTLRLQEATAGAKCMGTLTLTAATPVVTATTCAKTASRIFLTRTSIDADTTGDMAVTAISDGVSFSVTSEASDTGTVNWFIINEAS